MITRFFLFILALVSGVSAAQAAQSVRPAQSAVGSSAAFTSAEVLGSRAHVVSTTRPAYLEPVSRAACLISQMAPQHIVIAAFPRTYCGDRTRQ